MCTGNPKPEDLRKLGGEETRSHGDRHNQRFRGNRVLPFARGSVTGELYLSHRPPASPGRLGRSALPFPVIGRVWGGGTHRARALDGLKKPLGRIQIVARFRLAHVNHWGCSRKPREGCHVPSPPRPPTWAYGISTYFSTSTVSSTPDPNRPKDSGSWNRTTVACTQRTPGS